MNKFIYDIRDKFIAELNTTNGVAIVVKVWRPAADACELQLWLDRMQSKYFK